MPFMTAVIPKHEPVLKSFKASVKKNWLSRQVMLLLAMAVGLLSLGILGFILFSHNPFGPDPQTVLLLVLVNVIFLLSLGAVISWKMIGLWLARKRGSIGSRLQTRMVVMFSLVAVIPNIVVVIFSVSFFNLSLQSWFDERVSTAIEQTVNVAEAYLSEHKANIRADALAMANDVSRAMSKGARDEKQYERLLNTQALIRNLIEAVVFQKRAVLGKTALSFSILLDYAQIQPELLERADKGEVVILTGEAEDRVRALVKIPNSYDTYLLVGRFIDANVLAYMQKAQGSAKEYLRLKQQTEQIQLQFSFVFAGVALLLMFLTIWFGMAFAGELVKPVSELVAATERVKAGDFDTALRERPENDEVGYLSKAFNRMVSQLKRQRDDLMEANRQIDERRQFTEAVLANLSAGVLVLDHETVITLTNRSARELLDAGSEPLEGCKLSKLLPEMQPLLDQLRQSGRHMVQSDVHMTDHLAMTLLVRMAELPGEGVVVTFDDITELKAAERRAAWADVAQRVAHEMKNPLTPIQLSAERLKTKYAKELKDDQQNYLNYVDTITRHAEGIREMVEAFVDYARMPQPEFEDISLQKILNASVFTLKVAHPEIAINMSVAEEDMAIWADESQMTRAIDNLLKNAAEALEDKLDDKQIDITVTSTDQITQLTIADNGPGFAAEVLEKAAEPYITTKETGTGLGLAIVKKILLDHDATIRVRNRQDSEGADYRRGNCSRI